MTAFSLSWSTPLQNGHQLHANDEVLLVSWQNHLSCYTLRGGTLRLMLTIPRWSEHQISFLGRSPILLQRPSFGSFEIVSLSVSPNMSHWQVEVPESEDAATLQGEFVLASSPWAIQLSRISPGGVLQTTWEDRTASKAKQLLLTQEGSLAGAILQGESCVWSTTRSELLWHGPEALVCLRPWGWLAEKQGQLSLFDPAGYIVKGFPLGLRLLAHSDRYLVFASDVGGLLFNLRSSELRVIPVKAPLGAAFLAGDLLLIGGHSAVWVFDDDLSLQFDITPHEWREAGLVPDDIRGLLLAKDRVIALTSKQIICLK